MPSTFRQDAIPIRERLNALENHHHNSLYEAKGLLLGKNLLINGDKRESQRGDFSVASAVVNDDYWIDRYKISISGVTCNKQHNNFSSLFGSSSTLIEVTSTITGRVISQQKVEHFAELASRTITYAVEVVSNFPVNIYINDGVSSTYSSKHSGSGELELLTVTHIVSDSPTQLVMSVSSYDGANYAHTSGDYFEVGNEQLELGDKFTGFEYVLPAVNLLNCQRFFWNTGVVRWAAQNTGSNNYLFVPTPATMRTVPVITYEGFLDVDSTGLTISSFSRTPSGITQIIMSGSDAVGKRYIVDTFKFDAEI